MQVLVVFRVFTITADSLDNLLVLPGPFPSRFSLESWLSTVFTILAQVLISKGLLALKDVKDVSTSALKNCNPSAPFALMACQEIPGKFLFHYIHTRHTTWKPLGKHNQYPSRRKTICSTIQPDVKWPWIFSLFCCQTQPSSCLCLPQMTFTALLPPLESFSFSQAQQTLKYSLSKEINVVLINLGDIDNCPLSS